ncbi:MAG: ABC transporter permease [Chloroflexi bacterium]|nr:ABC transporter permease [Chloroflexota bacterium]MCA2002520.1 ABC transporter permease [Chloroflexota bacterium]
MATVESARLASPTSDSPTQRQLRALRRNPIAMLGLVIILFWALAALSAPHIGLRDPLAQKIGDRLKPPSSEYWFGTDELGRDVFSRVVYGARVSLPIGFIVILFAMTFGCLIGASAGYFGGAYDLLIMRLADITMAFPSIVLALAIAAVLGPSITNALIAMILVWWPEYARLMRSQVLSVKNNEYVAASVALGSSQMRTLFLHVLPNAFAPILVKASLDAGSVILNIAALSFIGLGAVPPTPEWGAMISLGRYKFYNWWLTTFPGLAILSVVLGYNFFGEGVRDAFDPRMT